MEEATSPDFKQQALVPLPSETHGGEDLGIYAIGPWSHLFQGTVEENYVSTCWTSPRRSASARRRPPLQAKKTQAD